MEFRGELSGESSMTRCADAELSRSRCPQFPGAKGSPREPAVRVTSAR